MIGSTSLISESHLLTTDPKGSQWTVEESRSFTCKLKCLRDSWILLESFDMPSSESSKTAKIHLGMATQGKSNMKKPKGKSFYTSIHSSIS